jgi:hypothetical protein
MSSVPERAADRARAEARAEAILAQIPEPDATRLYDALARVLLSAARHERTADGQDTEAES